MADRRETIERFAAITSLILFLYFIVFQILVVVGVVPVSVLWGGSYDELNWKLRRASIAGACILVGFAHIIYKRAEHLFQKSGPNSQGMETSLTTDQLSSPTSMHPSKQYVTSWIVTAYLALNTLGNFASKTAFERYVSGTLTLILTISCAIVSMSNYNTQYGCDTNDNDTE